MRKMAILLALLVILSMSAYASTMRNFVDKTTMTEARKNQMAQYEAFQAKKAQMAMQAAKSQPPVPPKMASSNRSVYAGIAGPSTRNVFEIKTSVGKGAGTSFSNRLQRLDAMAKAKVAKK